MAAVVSTTSTAKKSSGGVGRVLRDCAPFHESAATLVCIQCFKLLAFPQGARRVKCGYCSAVTSSIVIKCTSCKKKVTTKLGVTKVSCPHCTYQFRPLAKLKICVPTGKRDEAMSKDPISVRVVVDADLTATTRKAEKELVPDTAFRCSTVNWEHELGCDFNRVTFFHDKSNKTISTAQTPRELGICTGDKITIRRQKESSSTMGHDFVVAQFGNPANCAYCKKFIWGIYHQGKRCAKCHYPVHHRCAEMMTQQCEADLRQVFGIINASNDDDEVDVDEAMPVLGVVIDEAEQVAFAANCEEAVEPECDPNFMARFDKLSNFTDEEIQEIWLQYDQDESGTLDHDEVRNFFNDLLGANTNSRTKDVKMGAVSSNEAVDDAALDAAVDKFIICADTDNDGTISWEEFWYFFKAQQDSNALKALHGKSITTEDLYELWYKYDNDASGALEFDEIIRLLTDLNEEINGAFGKEKSASFMGKMETYIRPDVAMTWDEFCTSIVPLLKVVSKKQQQQDKRDEAAEAGAAAAS